MDAFLAEWDQASVELYDNEQAQIGGERNEEQEEVKNEEGDDKAGLVSLAEQVLVWSKRQHSGGRV